MDGIQNEPTNNLYANGIYLNSIQYSSTFTQTSLSLNLVNQLLIEKVAIQVH